MLMDEAEGASVAMPDAVICLPGGASSRGLSYWTQIAQCPRRAKLSEGAKSAPSPGQARGILTHALLEHYFLGFSLDQLDEMPFSPDDHPALADRATVAEARRLGRFLIQTAWGGDRRALGDVLGVEMEFSSAEWAERLGAPASPLTARFDMVIDIGDAHLERWTSLAAGGGAVYPGRWLVDLKVLSSRMGIGGYSASLASSWYPLACQTALGERVEGIIYLCLIATKAPALEISACPLDLNAEKILAAFFNNVRRKLADGGEAPDPSACVSAFGQVCPHYMVGCGRF